MCFTLKKCNKKKLNIGLEYKEKKIIGELIDDSTKERKTDIIKCLKAVLIKEKREKIQETNRIQISFH